MDMTDHAMADPRKILWPPDAQTAKGNNPKKGMTGMNHGVPLASILNDPPLLSGVALMVLLK
jgi:hypothetical protein